MIRRREAASIGPVGRARRRFWLLLAVAVLAGGALSSALGATSGPLTGLVVAASGLVLIGSLVGATRIMLALEHARQRVRERSGS